jgi:putative ABC transport system permease protein
MYAIEHGFLNLGKNKGRNILLGVIIFAIITATVVALAIYNTTGVIIKETQTALQCAVRIAPRMQTVGGGQQIAGGDKKNVAVSLEQYLTFTESQYLDGAEVKESSKGADGVDAVYYLKQPDMLAAFEAELRNKGLPDGYSVKTDESLFEKTAGAVESLQGISLTFLIVVMVLGGAIMILLSIIAIRERKYEIGVLRAMGMKKNKVVLMICTEIITITCICFMIGIGAGAALSQPVSDALMASQTQSSSRGSTTLAGRLGETDEAAVRFNHIDVSLDSVTAWEIFGISILLASIAGAISVSQITKCEPIKILMEIN